MGRKAWLSCRLLCGLAVLAFALIDCAQPASVMADDGESKPANPSLSESFKPELGNSQAPASTFELRGRVEADAIMIDQSVRNRAILGDIQNVVGFRRARLGAFGTAGEQIRWIAEFDFAGGNIAFKDLYLAVDKLPILGEVAVGHFREPFSLEGQTSSNYFPLMERSLINSLDPGRNWGLKIHKFSSDERVTFTAGAFKSGTDRTGTDTGDGNDMAYTARLTGLPWFADEQYLFHLGGAYSLRFPKNDRVSINQGAQSSLIQTGDDPLTPFIPTITIPASQFQLYNLQAALVLGSLSFQSEWYTTWIDQLGGSPVVLHGSYVMASYFLTGEHRRYEPQLGTFGAISVISPFVHLRGKNQIARGPGAWELVARFEYADYTSGNLQPAPSGLLIGNRGAAGDFGVNWYLHDNARIMFNYTHIVPVDPNFGPSRADAFSVRCAFFW